MWFEFLCAAALLALLLFLPGTLLLRACSFARTTSVIFAPVVSLFLLIMLSIVFPVIGIAFRWDVALGSTAGIALIAYLIAFLARRRAPRPLHDALAEQSLERPWLRYGLYLGIGIVLTGALFVYPLDGAASFVQDSDNSWHLAVIKSFADSANMSLLDVTLYPDFPIDQLALVPTAGTYYPAVWHLLAALPVQALDAPVSLGANAANTVLLALVFPSALYAMMSVLFKGLRGAWVFGALFGMAFAAFPWSFLMPPAGPLYPSFLGYILVPYAAALLVRLTDGAKRSSGLIPAIGLLLLCLFDMAAAHPTAIFTCAVFLFPYGVYRVGTFISRRFATSPRRNLLVAATCAGFIACGIAVWVISFNLPALQSVVSFRWKAFATPWEELTNILALSFRRDATQVMLGLLVLAGIAYTLRHRKYLWISCAYAFACIICFVGAVNDGFLKGFLAGFWYTDPYRTGAMAALIGIPLAALGARAVIVLLVRTVKRFAPPGNVRTAVERLVTVLGCVVLVGSSFFPDFKLPNGSVVSTGFGDYLYCMKAGNSAWRPNLFDRAEMSFTQRVRDVVGDAVVYNNADDGSVFAYEFADLQLCYRRSAAELTKNESFQSELLRLHIDELATNEEVRRIVAEAEIRYILVLDYGGEATDERCFYGYYKPEKWAGINGITDDTPGLEVVLSEGDMRLYRVTTP